MGYLAQRPATAARTSSAFASKSEAVLYIRSATSFISSSLNPLLVTAGEPSLTPLVMKGVWGSLGIAFCLL